MLKNLAISLIFRNFVGVNQALDITVKSNKYGIDIFDFVLRSVWQRFRECDETLQRQLAS